MKKENVMEKEVSIQSIKILMGKREVELSIEEAKKLKKALEEIFGTKVIEKTEHIHYHDYFRYYDWNKYYCVDSPKKYDFGTVYCSNSAKESKGVLSMDNTSVLCLAIQ